MSRTGRTTAAVALLRALRGATRPGEPGLGERFRAVPRLVRATLAGRYPGATRGQLGLLALALLYVLSPVDLVPEAVLPFVGLADDAVVAAWLAGRLLGDTADFLGWERTATGGAEYGDRGDAAGQRPDVVRGDVIR